MKSGEATKLSIIVPIYNQHNYLRQCVDSLIGQTFKEFELILVDDGSTDDSGQICDDYAMQDERIRVIHKENGGLSDARNKGIDIATGQYLAFVDSDDYVAKNMYEVLIHTLEEQKADLVVCNCSLIDENGNSTSDSALQGTLKNRVQSGKDIMYSMDEYAENHWLYVVAWNKVYRRELFETLRYPFGKLHEDEFVFHQLYSKCKKVVSIEQPLYYYRRMQGTIMDRRNLSRRMENVTEAFYKRILFFLEQEQKETAVKTEEIMFASLWTAAWDKQCRKQKEQFKKCISMSSDINRRLHESKSISNKLYRQRRAFYRTPFLYQQFVRIKAGIRRRLEVRKNDE